MNLYHTYFRWVTQLNRSMQLRQTFSKKGSKLIVSALWYLFIELLLLCHHTLQFNSNK